MSESELIAAELAEVRAAIARTHETIRAIQRRRWRASEKAMALAPMELRIRVLQRLDARLLRLIVAEGSK